VFQQVMIAKVTVNNYSGL